MVRLEEVEPGKTICRMRGAADSEPLTPYERRVLDQVRRKAVDGVVPTDALTTGPEDASRGWHRAFGREVIGDAQERGLTRNRWPGWLVSLLGVGPFAIGGLLYLSSMVGGESSKHPAAAAIAGGVAVVGIVLILLADGRLSRSSAQLPTVEGKGMTARCLLHDTYKMRPGDTILIHAAAGGVGLIMCQWAKHLGATVIGTVSSDEKAAIAHAHGCDHPIVYTREDFAERVREITGGEGVPVVYDSVGKATFEDSLKCLRRHGLMASFGEASGDPDPMPPRRLGALGSIYLTHPSVSNYTVTRAELLAAAHDLFAMVGSGKIKIEISRTYPLQDAPRAHADIESRQTTGSIVLAV